MRISMRRSGIVVAALAVVALTAACDPTPAQIQQTTDAVERVLLQMTAVPSDAEDDPDGYAALCGADGESCGENAQDIPATQETDPGGTEIGAICESVGMTASRCQQLGHLLDEAGIPATYDQHYQLHIPDSHSDQAAEFFCEIMLSETEECTADN